MTDEPLTRHRLDVLFLPFFLVGIVYSALVSLPESLGVPVSADSPWPPLRSLYSWAVEQEPQHLDMSPALHATILYDGFVQLPLLVVLTIGLWRLEPWPWLRPLGLVYAATAVTNMYFYFMQTFLGPDSPPHLGVYLPLNLPWLVVPALLAYRLWPASPSARSLSASAWRRNPSATRPGPASATSGPENSSTVS
jgi:hypothetical protein